MMDSWDGDMPAWWGGGYYDVPAPAPVAAPQPAQPTYATGGTNPPGWEKLAPATQQWILNQSSDPVVIARWTAAYLIDVPAPIVAPDMTQDLSSRAYYDAPAPAPAPAPAAPASSYDPAEYARLRNEITSYFERLGSASPQQQTEYLYLAAAFDKQQKAKDALDQSSLGSLPAAPEPFKQILNTQIKNQQDAIVAKQESYQNYLNSPCAQLGIQTVNSTNPANDISVMQAQLDQLQAQLGTNSDNRWSNIAAQETPAMVHAKNTALQERQSRLAGFDSMIGAINYAGSGQGSVNYDKPEAHQSGWETQLPALTAQRSSLIRDIEAIQNLSPVDFASSAYTTSPSQTDAGQKVDFSPQTLKAQASGIYSDIKKQQDDRTKNQATSKAILTAAALAAAAYGGYSLMGGGVSSAAGTAGLESGAGLTAAGDGLASAGFNAAVDSQLANSALGLGVDASVGSAGVATASQPGLIQGVLNNGLGSAFTSNPTAANLINKTAINTALNGGDPVRGFTSAATGSVLGAASSGIGNFVSNSLADSGLPSFATKGIGSALGSATTAAITGRDPLTAAFNSAVGSAVGGANGAIGSAVKDATGSSALTNLATSGLTSALTGRDLNFGSVLSGAFKDATGYLNKPEFEENSFSGEASVTDGELGPITFATPDNPNPGLVGSAQSDDSTPSESGTAMDDYEDDSFWDVYPDYDTYDFQGPATDDNYDAYDYLGENEGNGLGGGYVSDDAYDYNGVDRGNGLGAVDTGADSYDFMGEGNGNGLGGGYPSDDAYDQMGAGNGNGLGGGLTGAGALAGGIKTATGGVKNGVKSGTGGIKTATGGIKTATGGGVKTGPIASTGVKGATSSALSGFSQWAKDTLGIDIGGITGTVDSWLSNNKGLAEILAKGVGSAFDQKAQLEKVKVQNQGALDAINLKQANQLADNARYSGSVAGLRQPGLVASAQGPLSRNDGSRVFNGNGIINQVRA